MFRRAKKIWLFLKYFLLVKEMTWRNPRRSEVLIFDALGQELLMEYFGPWNPEILHVRGEKINLRALSSSLFRRGKKFDAYVDYIVEKVRPRLIVTFADNNPQFYSLSLRHPHVTTLFLQNGIRGFYGDIFEILDANPSKPCMKVDYMMTFGKRIGAEYTRHIQGLPIPMGSIKNNRFPKSRDKISNNIAFVSQYRNMKGIVMGGEFYSRQAFFERADRLVLTFLLKYAERHAKTLFIVPSCGYLKDSTLQKEKTYYDTLLKHSFEYSEWHWQGSSYDAADTADVVVSIDSTFAYESAARGNKTAIFPIRSELLGVIGLSYGWPGRYPDEGVFWTNRPDPAAFERILDHLFSISDEQWRVELSRSGFADIMTYDPGNTILQSVLLKELGSAPGVSNELASATFAS